MKLSEEMAVRLHRMMWSDMQRELGDTPAGCDRNEFKEKWIKMHFPGEYVYHYCFLCEYSYSEKNGIGCAACSKCPIKWPDDTCLGHRENSSYTTTPISKILALPARNPEIAKHAANDKETLAEWYYAFKQYADEQKAPIFRQLSKASGLSENNQSVYCHIDWIKNKARQEGRDETKQQMKDLLAKESNLDRNRPIDDHMREIVKNSMEAGATEERDRIQKKIEELLS